jgi:hypothetical protein
MKTFHLANAQGKNARLPLLKSGTGKKTSKRTESLLPVFSERIHRGDHTLEVPEDPDRLVSFVDTLLKEDPEIDMQHAGLVLENITRGYRVPGTAELTGNFKKMVAQFATDGTLKKKAPIDLKDPNLDTETPIKMGKTMPIKEAFSKFVFHNHFVIRHDDGVQFEFLYNIAKELWEKQEVASLGAGPKGNQPLVFVQGPTAYKAFLYGEVQDGKYRLLVLLTRLEIKVPEKPVEAPAADEAKTEEPTAE